MPKLDFERLSMSMDSSTDNSWSESMMSLSDDDDKKKVSVAPSPFISAPMDMAVGKGNDAAATDVHEAQSTASDDALPSAEQTAAEYQSLLDSYEENMKAAQEAALDFVYHTDVPVLNLTRDLNQCHVARLLKSYKKQFPFVSEQAVILVILLDFLSCSNQESQLYTIYEKTGVPRREKHLNQLLELLSSTIRSSTFQQLSIPQMKSMQRLIEASVERLPEHLRNGYHFLKTSLVRKIQFTEREERERKTNPLYAFVDEYTSPSPSSSPSYSSSSSSSDSSGFYSAFDQPSSSSSWKPMAPSYNSVRSPGKPISKPSPFGSVRSPGKVIPKPSPFGCVRSPGKVTPKPSPFGCVRSPGKVTPKPSPFGNVRSPVKSTSTSSLFGCVRSPGKLTPKTSASPFGSVRSPGKFTPKPSGNFSTPKEPSLVTKSPKMGSSVTPASERSGKSSSKVTPQTSKRSGFTKSPSKNVLTAKENTQSGTSSYKSKMSWNDEEWYELPKKQMTNQHVPAKTFESALDDLIRIQRSTPRRDESSFPLSPKKSDKQMTKHIKSVRPLPPASTSKPYRKPDLEMQDKFTSSMKELQELQALQRRVCNQTPAPGIQKRNAFELMMKGRRLTH